MLLKLGAKHNTLSLTKYVAPEIVNYEVGVQNAVRPYRIINSADYKNACMESIEDKQLKNLLFVGSIDQLANTTDLMINFTDWKTTLRNGYQDRLH